MESPCKSRGTVHCGLAAACPDNRPFRTEVTREREVQTCLKCHWTEDIALNNNPPIRYINAWLANKLQRVLRLLWSSLIVFNCVIFVKFNPVHVGSPHPCITASSRILYYYFRYEYCMCRLGVTFSPSAKKIAFYAHEQFLEKAKPNEKVHISRRSRTFVGYLRFAHLNTG